MNQLTFTHTGQNKLAAAVASGNRLQLAHIGVGLGDGGVLTPESEAIAGEILRVPIQSQAVNGRQITVEGTISEDRGPYLLRCMGVFDNMGALIAYAPLPEVLKPGMTDGFGVAMKVRAYLTFAASEEVVSIEIVSTVAYATEQDAKAGASMNTVMTPLRVKQSAPTLGLLVHAAAQGVTGLTGGAGKLDGVATVELSPSLWAVDDATHDWGIWELIAGTDAASPGAIVRPLDFHAATNAKVWKRRS